MNSSVTHTPGPWHACHNGACSCRQVWSIPGDVPVFIAGSDKMAMVGLAHHKWGDSVDLIYGEIPLPETEANARLIAAAPELLAACKNLLLMVEPDTCLEDIHYRAAHGDEMIASARAAVAKAEGRP